MADETRKLRCKLAFDSYSTSGENWVAHYGVDSGWTEIVEVGVGGKIAMTITANRDQWGTWIDVDTEGKSFGVAQEDGTRSFIDSLIIALVRLRSITDVDTAAPTPAIVEQAAAEPRTE